MRPIGKLLVAAIMTIGSIPLYANWGGAAGGSVGTGAFKPFGTDQVEMQNETLTILLYSDRAQVTVEYVLKNTGDAVELKAGFPCLAAKSKKTDYVEIENYKISADGTNVPYVTEKGELGNWKTLFTKEFLDNYEPDEEDEASAQKPGSCDECRIWWLTSKVRFEKGETKRIRIQYESLYEFSEGGPSDDDYHNSDYFRYLLSTASAWNGPIQNGVVTIRAVTVDPDVIQIKPSGRFARSGSDFVWRFSNLKPVLGDNIEVSLNNKFYTLFNYEGENRGDSSWYSFEGDKYYFDFHGYTAKASSEKPDYPAKAVTDFDQKTAWVAGANGGIGESIELTLESPTHVDQIGIIPGYAKSKDIYFANNRIQELTIAVNHGAPQTVTLPDEYISFSPYSKKGYELVDLEPYTGPAKTITLTIKKVFPGSRYKDTCISEILLRKRLKEKPQVKGAR